MLAMLTLSRISYSRDIILVTYTLENKSLKLVKEHLKNVLKIPQILVQYKQVSGPCELIPDTIMQICLDGDKMIPLSNQEEIIKKAFPVFLEGDIKKATKQFEKNGGDHV